MNGHFTINQNKINVNGCNSSFVMGRRDREIEREREKDTVSGRTQTENSDKLQGSIFVPL